MKIRGCFLLICCLGTVWPALPPRTPEISMAYAAAEDNGSPSLNFDQASTGEETIEVNPKSANAPFSSIGLAFSFFIYLFVLVIIFLYVKKNQHILPHSSIRLSAFPPSVKVLLTFVLFMFSLVHAFGLWDAYLQTHEVFESAEEYFGYMKLAKLISLSHPHLFGFAMMYLLVGSLFIFTAWSEPIKTLILTVPILSAAFDVLSWWMIKMVSSDFELLAIFTGITFSAGFGLMTLLILYEMWFVHRHNMMKKGLS